MVGGRARGGNRGKNVGRGPSRETSLSPARNPAGRDTRLMGCGSSGAGLRWTCEGLGCNVSKKKILVSMFPCLTTKAGYHSIIITRTNALP
jgi:hypothetical protein